MQTFIAKLRTTSKAFSPKAWWREILSLLILLLAIVFFRSERKELHAIIPYIRQSSPLWVNIGFGITLLCIIFQAGIYRQSFAAIGLLLQWGKALALFLKRNFISVFLPAGSISSLAYSPSQVRKAGFSKMQVQQASGLFGFVGLLTVFLAGLPVVIFTIFPGRNLTHAWAGLTALLCILAFLFFTVRSIRNKGWLFNLVNRKFPSFSGTLSELFAVNVRNYQLGGAVVFSLGVELCGMFHVYIAMLALGMPPSFGAAAAAYIIAVLMMVVSPFLKGLGFVELSMVYVLEQFGYTTTQAVSITVLFRVFEFWLPLLAGFIAFAWKGRKLFLRIAPALFSFALGFVNIISAITPPLHNRIRLLEEYLPLSTIHASNLLVLFVGLGLLMTSAFLLRGLRSAWVIALTLSSFSLLGHLSKALDYEEAIIAAVTIIVLIATTSQYRIHSSNKWMQAGLKTAAISFLAVLLFGFISFYFIDVRHFGVDFTWQQSLVHTFKIFLLVEDESLYPVTKFGHEFIWLIRTLGFLTWGFLLFTLIKPALHKQTASYPSREKAALLLDEFGNSAMDYFKLYKDKLLFFSDVHEAFIAYKITTGFAIVLEEPVCAPENKTEVLREFDHHCRKMGLKPAFYRVDEDSLPWFNQLKKQRLLIGQEAILDIAVFSLEGKDKASLRNGLNSLRKKGYTVNIHIAPHTESFILQLKKVSDEWLEHFEKEELVFSQGMFDEKELQQQDVITIKDAEEAVVAFLNIIPDYAEDECTYDLIRKTSLAPGASMDALIIRLVDYAKDHQKLFINLGLAPMTGLEQPDNTAEQIIKLAAERIKRFQHYKGLREFKEKYATLWENKYLVYDIDFDLLQLPIALNNIMKP